METGRTFAPVHLVLEIGAGVEFGEERIPHGRESLDLLSQEFALHFQISDIRTQAGVEEPKTEHNKRTETPTGPSAAHAFLRSKSAKKHKINKADKKTREMRGRTHGAQGNESSI